MSVLRCVAYSFKSVLGFRQKLFSLGSVSMRTWVFFHYVCVMQLDKMIAF